MSSESHDAWLDRVLPLYSRLTESVVTIIENLLRSEGIEYLSVVGRTKDKESSLEKIRRKGYKSPQAQLTDISGVRVILYLESDVEKVSEIIQKSFHVDGGNSLNKDEIMSVDQIGYRSVHFVCNLGFDRGRLAEYSGLSKLTFEFQVRTVLQHAWAELAHDRNYKFSGSLPKKLERQLYLYAGMLEIADRGFDEVSRQIDSYIVTIDEKSISGDLDVDINSVSIQRFIEHWCEKNGVEIESSPKISIDDLIRELNEFGLYSLADLNDIIPNDYAAVLKELRGATNIFGVVRDWMLIKDWRRFNKDVNITWVVTDDELGTLEHYIPRDEINDFLRVFGLDDV